MNNTWRDVLLVVWIVLTLVTAAFIVVAITMIGNMAAGPAPFAHVGRAAPVALWCAAGAVVTGAGIGPSLVAWLSVSALVHEHAATRAAIKQSRHRTF